MMLARCDECCNVLDGVDNGIVFECDKEVYDKYKLEHICEECLESSDELVLITNRYVNLVKLNK